MLYQAELCPDAQSQKDARPSAPRTSGRASYGTALQGVKCGGETLANMSVIDGKNDPAIDGIFLQYPLPDAPSQYTRREPAYSAHQNRRLMVRVGANSVYHSTGSPFPGRSLGSSLSRCR
jgi:hypothetical protein